MYSLVNVSAENRKLSTLFTATWNNPNQAAIARQVLFPTPAQLLAGKRAGTALVTDRISPAIVPASGVQAAGMTGAPADQPAR